MSRKQNTILLSFFCLFAALQAILSTKIDMPENSELSLQALPPPHYASITTLGDEQLAFRCFTLIMQNHGDARGQFTPFKYYNYENLSEWLYALDTLDTESAFLPTIAAYYYSHTQVIQDLYYLIDYLVHYGTRQVEKQWWWILQSILLAKNTIHDDALALELSSLLLQNTAVPIWVRGLNPILEASTGNPHQAIRIFEEILAHEKNLSTQDIKQLQYLMNQLFRSLYPSPKE